MPSSRPPGDPGSSPADETQLAGAAGATRTSSEGWLTSSGAIDHGRFPPGTVLEGRYRVIGVLGKGGMGEVYRADDLRLGQPVALKFLPETLGRDPVRLAQFHGEVRTARQVSHKSVCRVYDIGEADGHLFLTMEYVDGEDLASLLRRIGRLPEDKAIEIARQICMGLAAAHERGVLHRDLKPANIMLDGAGHVRIMDFGLAAVGAVTDIRAGTPAYMAPEQLEGREVTVKSDIYALGLVLYELFTGRRGFTAASIAELMEQHSSGAITPPTTIVTTLDPTIERALMRCLDADPARRPASAFAVAASLPGGDPLAAALAAGETPSPEMVAAAGGESATLSPVAGVSFLALAAVLTFAAASLADRTSLLARVPLKPAAVLLDRAAEVRRQLGYTEPVVDDVSGFGYDLSWLNWTRRHEPERKSWPELATGQPAVVTFWYRTNPVPLVPMSPLSTPSFSDPPLVVAGITQLSVDTAGRLLSFSAVPPQKEASPAGAASTDWRVLFTLAGLDHTTFVETPPARTPASYADERKAWRGPLPGTTAPVTIEAAAYRGRPVSFEIVGPWTEAPRDPGSDSDDGDDRGGPTIFILALVVTASVLAYRNLRSGRADRRGALRIGLVMFAVTLSTWLLLPHVKVFGPETNRMFIWIGLSLFVGGVMCFVYLAIEPFARRSWPTMLVGWSRALAGRFHDPIIGRDLALGGCAGLALTVLEFSHSLAPRLLGWPEPIPPTPNIGTIDHSRYFVLTITGALNNGIQSGLLEGMAFTVFREIILRLLNRLRVARVSATFVTAVLVLVIVVLVEAAESRATPREVGLLVAYEILFACVFLTVLLRYGLLASVIMFTIHSLTLRMPLTLVESSLYAGAAWLTMAIVFAFALVGVWMARGAEPMFARAAR